MKPQKTGEKILKQQQEAFKRKIQGIRASDD